MKHNWEIKKLEDIADINYGTRIVQKVSGGFIYPVYGGGGATFKSDDYNREDCLIVSRFAMSKQCTRRVVGKFFLNDSGLTIVPKNNSILQSFLDVQIIGLNDKIYSLGKGAAQRNLDIKELKKLKISFPKSIETQQTIVKELDLLSTLINKQKAQLTELDRLAQSVFYDMFGDPIENEKGWEVRKVGEVCIINPPKSEIKEMDTETEVSFVPMANVSESGELELVENRKIKDVWSGFTYFADNDVLFAKITPCMENGKRTIAKQLKNGIGFGSTEFHVLRPKEKVTSNYLFQIISLSDFKVIAERKMTGSAGQKRVPKTFLEQFEVSVPPLSLQADFAKRIEKIEAQKVLVMQSIAQSEQLLASRMQYYFE